MPGLRDYQGSIVDEAREAVKTAHRVFVQAPTGSGKTVIMAAIVESAFQKERRVWIIVPRHELLKQSSAHLSKWGVKHGFIDAAHKESRAYRIHIVSKDTLLRRLDKIKEYPDIIIFDEGHLAIDAQKKIIEAAEKRNIDKGVYAIAFSATPERMDGRGLNEIYERLIMGPPLTYLTQAGYLSPIRYFAPPLEGAEALHWKMGEVQEEELEALMKKHAVYGKAAEYYKNYGQGRRALVFCRNIKASEEIAAEFRSAGIRAESIDGSMGMGKRRLLVDGLVSGRLDVITSAELFCYGVDIPTVEYIALMRPTQSKAIYFQQVGRGMRVSEGKKDCLVFDHVNNISRFQDPRYPGVPLFSVPDLSWDFAGSKKKAKKGKEPPAEVRRCPFSAFEICEKSIRCPQCERYIPAADGETPVIESVPLQERRAPEGLHVITAAEKREAQDGVIKYTEIARLAADDESYDKAVAELVKIAERLGYSPMWVYHRITANEYVVDVRLLASIARAKGYKKGWTHFKREELKAQMKEAAG
jgi:superfamily II DNA or RNA helicase